MATKSKEDTLAWLKSVSGELATKTLATLESTLPWYRKMPAARRSAVGMVAQAGISSFISWYDDPTSTDWVAADVFGVAPRELLRSVSLQETLQLIRVVVEVAEEHLATDSPELRDAILLYSREIAFSAADVYARAAEARGLWDQRLEALVVDSILSGQYDRELPSRIAALGWSGHGDVSVLVGTTSPDTDSDQIRRILRHLHADALVGIQGKRLVVVAGHRIPEPGQPELNHSSFVEIAKALDNQFGSGPVVVGPTVSSVVDAGTSAKAALSAFSVAGGWRHLPRPVLADDSLPERVLAGDHQAKTHLLEAIYYPLRDHPLDLLDTAWAYFQNGHSLEATAKDLYIHANTVRYRLRKIAEIIEWDPTHPRDALTIHFAIVVGKIGDNQLTSSTTPPSP
jgi:hypothetical protein